MFLDYTIKEETSVWQQKRSKIMKDFDKQSSNMEVFLNEGKDKQNKAKVASISADEFQIQFKKLRKKMNQFWAKEDKVACLKICIQ